MNTKEIKKSNFPSCFLIALLALFSSLSLHAKENSDFKMFLNDLDTLLSDTAFEAEINHDFTQKKHRIKSKTIVLRKIESTKPAQKAIVAHHIKCTKNNKTQSNTVVAKNDTTTEKKTVQQASNLKNEYWNKLHFIESSAGKKLYRKRNKARSCKWTTTPCGHHQLSVKALKDIGCTSLKCRSAREDYKKSLSMSKKFAEINAQRMKKKGYKSLPHYQRYLVHQQGAYGLGKILDAQKGKKNLSKKTLRYMANNSPFSYKTLRRAGSKGAARKFLHFWKEKWDVKMSKRVASR